jgi:hypothetical protein
MKNQKKQKKKNGLKSGMNPSQQTTPSIKLTFHGPVMLCWGCRKSSIPVGYGLVRPAQEKVPLAITVPILIVGSTLAQ